MDNISRVRLSDNYINTLIMYTQIHRKRPTETCLVLKLAQRGNTEQIYR